MEQIIPSISLDQYLPLITALCSGLVGGLIALVSVNLTNRANEARLKLQIESDASQRKKELLRERGEELYELIDKWMNVFAGHYFRMSGVMQGKFSLNDFFGMEVKSLNENPVNFGRALMLLDVYFSSARPHYDVVEKKREELIAVETAHGHAYDSGDHDGVRFLQPYVECQKNFEKAGEDLKSRIIEAIRAI